MKSPDNILVIGATGYVGSKLVPRLVEAGYHVRVLARDPLRVPQSFRASVEIVRADVLEPSTLPPAFRDVSMVYYLVHAMAGGEQKFEERDRLAARHVLEHAEAAGVQRILFLGGLGRRGDVLSPHLRSRHEVGDILRSGKIPVTEFRAAVIVGSGSSSFEMVHHLVNRLPIMICPRWLVVRTQPIAIDDVLSYLLQALRIPASTGRILDIGGPEILTYREMMLTVASVLGLRRLLIQVPVLTPRLSSYWVNLVTPVSADLARSLIESVRQETICENDDAGAMFDVRPLSYEEAVRKALAAVLVTPSGYPEIHALDPTHILGDHREMVIERPAGKVYGIVSKIGGENGWYAADWLWRLRGWIDKALGGVGMRNITRGNRPLTEGDQLDFWRVERVIPNEVLRLRAEMRVWGRAWLEFRVESLDASRCRLHQQAWYYPKGLGGILYWYSIYPLHAYVFRSMIRAIARLAEE